MKKENKKILIITYYWPPSGGSGVQRWVKFTKYLPEYGWDPIILTVDPEKASFFIFDESLNNLVNENVQVYKTSSFEPLKLASKIIGKKNIAHSGFSNIDKKSFTQKSLKFLRGNLFSVDPRKGWNKYALPKALELIKKYDIKHVVTTSPPHSTQLIGLSLKKLVNFKWVADLRDPWTDIFFYDELMKLPFLKRKEERIEKNVLENADIVLTVSSGLKEIFAQKISKSDKIKIIENGFDKSDFSAFDPNFPHHLKGVFNILYVGVISELYNLSVFLMAFKNTVEIDPTIHLTFVGIQSEQIKKTISALKLDKYVTYFSYVKKTALLNFYAQSQLNLLAIPNTPDNKGIVTGKIFEYISLNIPIIGVGPTDGDAAKILNEVDGGKMFDYSDSLKIEKYILDVKDGNERPQFKDSTKFSRKELSIELSKILHSI